MCFVCACVGTDPCSMVPRPFYSSFMSLFVVCCVVDAVLACDDNNQLTGTMPPILPNEIAMEVSMNDGESWRAKELFSTRGAGPMMRCGRECAASLFVEMLKRLEFLLVLPLGFIKCAIIPIKLIEVDPSLLVVKMLSKWVW